jgi:hypothetical protein
MASCFQWILELFCCSVCYLYLSVRISTHEDARFSLAHAKYGVRYTKYEIRNANYEM